jgi:hypothetical protein
MRRYALAAALCAALLALPALSYTQGAPVRLELKPWPVPPDGILRCKPGDEPQVQLVGYDAARQETSLNQYRPTAESSNPEAATAEVPAGTGHQVRVRCLSEGKARVTAAYGQASATLRVEVGGGPRPSPQPSPSPVEPDTWNTDPKPSPSPTPAPTPQPTPSPQPVGQGLAGYEVVQAVEGPRPDSFAFIAGVARCPLGKKVIGGGASITLSSNGNVIPYYLVQSEPKPGEIEFGEQRPDEWVATFMRQAGYTPTGATYKVRVTAVCAYTQ